LLIALLVVFVLSLFGGGPLSILGKGMPSLVDCFKLQDCRSAVAAAVEYWSGRSAGAVEGLAVSFFEASPASGAVDLADSSFDAPCFLNMSLILRLLLNSGSSLPEKGSISFELRPRKR